MTRRRSTIPRVCTALVAMCNQKTGDEVDALDVHDATLMSQSNDYLIIGFDDDEELPPIDGGRKVASLGAGDDTEEYNVLCLLSTWGQGDIAEVRQRLFDYLDALDQRLVDSNRLNGLVAKVDVGDFSFAQPVTPEGATATLRFHIHIEAWRTP